MLPSVIGWIRALSLATPSAKNRQGTKSRDCERVARREPPQLRRVDHPGCGLQKQARGATMLRKIVLTAMIVMAVPTVGMAQREEHPSRERPGEFRGPRPGGPPGRGNSEDHIPVDRQDQGNS